MKNNLAPWNLISTKELTKQSTELFVCVFVFTLMTNDHFTPYLLIFFKLSATWHHSGKRSPCLPYKDRGHSEDLRHTGGVYYGKWVRSNLCVIIMRLREVAEGESIKRLTRCRAAASQLRNKCPEIQIQTPQIWNQISFLGFFFFVECQDRILHIKTNPNTISLIKANL